MIELGSQDVIRLYGQYLFVIPNEEKQTEIVVPKIQETIPVPVAEIPAPVAETPVPVAETPVPVAETPVPVAETPAPVAETPVPVAEIPAPVAEIPAPVAATPPPVEIKQEEVVPTPELTTGTAVVWKMRPQSRIAMVIDEAAFKNRAMTIILKDCVERAGMPTNLIGFGILKTGESTFDFTQQPVPFALAFSPGISESKIIRLPGAQEVYPMPDLADIIMNQDKQEALITLLKQLNERL